MDNGTDKVYPSIGAASRTSGSQKAGAAFALAADDTNPQGIADPPAGVPIPVGPIPTRSMAPARTVLNRLGLAAPSPSPIAVPSGPLSALDRALDGLGTGSSSEPGTDSIVLDKLNARRRRAN